MARKSSSGVLLREVIEYVLAAILTAFNLGYVLIASLIAAWVINPAFAVFLFAIACIMGLVGLASATGEKREGKR
jgi:hypothetical protein